MTHQENREHKRLRRTCISIFLLTLIVSPITLFPLVSAKEAPSQPVTVYIPTVIITKTGNETVLVKAEVSVTNGTGQVSITGASFDRLFRLSVEASAIISSFVYGFDYWSYNYSVRLSFNRTTYISGPSGSLALALAFYAALADEELDESVIASGMINPDGTIGQVSYLKEKAQSVSTSFNTFMYPLDQDMLRTNLTTQKRIGPYPIGVTKKIVEPIELSFGNMSAHSSGDIFEALAHTLKTNGERFLTSPDFPQPKDENITRVSREIYNLLLYETLQTSDEIKYIVPFLIFRSRSLELEVNSTLETADMIIALSWLSQKEGNTFASIEILFQAYLRLKYIEYLLGLLLNNMRVELISQDVGSEVSQAFMAMEQIQVSSIEAITAKAYGKLLLSEAAKMYDIAEPVLRFIHLARADKILEATREGALKMAQVKTLAKKAGILVTMASSMNGVFSIEEKDTYESAKRYVGAVRTIYLYAYEVSLASGVFSDSLAQAGYNLWLAERNVQTDPMLSMTYATETYFYTSTYMALHPGYREIADARLPYIRNTTWTMIEATSETHSPIISWTYTQFGEALSANTSRIMSLEKSISYLILNEVVRRDYRSGQIYTEFPQWLELDEEDIEPPPPAFPWINLIPPLIPIVLLGSMASLGERISAARRLKALVLFQKVKKEAETPQ